MDTVNNIASAASRAIWGEGTTAEEKKNGVSGSETVGQEPVSGELGDVKSGEPYDKGNVGSEFRCRIEYVRRRDAKQTQRFDPIPKKPVVD